MASKRGFGGMSPEKRKAIARMGGKAAHLKGVAHQWTVDEARVAGQKGGTITQSWRKRLLSPDTSAA